MLKLFLSGFQIEVFGANYLGDFYGFIKAFFLFRILSKWKVIVVVFLLNIFFISIVFFFTSCLLRYYQTAAK